MGWWWKTYADGENLWALTDQLGSVRDLIDNDGTVRLHRQFDSYGNITAETHFDTNGFEITEGQTGYSTIAFGFTGKLFDVSTGLQNNLHRWYDATVGRWASQDPIGFEAGDANVYRYVENAATTLVDREGLAPEWHHLLVQKHRGKFEEKGFLIDSAEFGWIIDAKQHRLGKEQSKKLHPQWDKCWDDFLLYTKTMLAQSRFASS